MLSPETCFAFASLFWARFCWRKVQEWTVGENDAPKFREVQIGVKETQKKKKK